MTIRKHAKIDTAEINCHSHCPYCNYGPLDGVTSALFTDEPAPKEKDIKPVDGNVTICGECAEILIFTENDGKLGVRIPTQVDMEKMQQDPEEWEIIQEIVEFAKHKKRKPK